MADPVVTGLSLCSGAGGLELGLGLALPGYMCLGYVERESFAAATLLDRMEDALLEPAPIFAGDLADFDARSFAGVDLVSAGFPCQPWSVAGAQRGATDERWIWSDIVRVLGEVQPGWVFLENVPGLVSGGGLGPIIGDLHGLGFDAEWCVLGAGALGAPHRRSRLFILAYRPGVARLVYTRPRGSGERAPESRGASDSVGHPLHERRRSDGANGPVDSARGPGVLLADRLAEPTRGGRGERGESGGAVADSEPGDAGEVHAGRGEEAGAQLGRAPEGTRGQRVATGLPLFPPGPGELELWTRVLTQAPTLEPAFCRVAHGLADRVDRLRTLGNGVHPLQAAVAFLLLAHRADILER